MACWCETNDKEKTKSIADAEARISDLTTKIEELTASSARLNTEIKNLEKEVAENQAALDKATAIRLLVGVIAWKVLLKKRSPVTAHYRLLPVIIHGISTEYIRNIHKHS